jgi:hypothetical protein
VPPDGDREASAKQLASYSINWLISQRGTVDLDRGCPGVGGGYRRRVKTGGGHPGHHENGEDGGDSHRGQHCVTSMPFVTVHVP